MKEIIKTTIRLLPSICCIMWAGFLTYHDKSSWWAFLLVAVFLMLFANVSQAMDRKR